MFARWLTSAKKKQTHTDKARELFAVKNVPWSLLQLPEFSIENERSAIVVELLKGLKKVMKESIMSHLQVEDILVVSEEEETSPLFSSPRTTRHVEVQYVLFQLTFHAWKSVKALKIGRENKY